MGNPKQPNILLIMDDQHRWDYLGCYGTEFVDTPNIDRLAASGMRFTNAFTNVPLCAPTRIGLATGMHPLRIGCMDNGCYIPSQYPTYYQRLRDNGYRVGCVGKLDLMKPDLHNGIHGDRPAVYQWGFTHPLECEGKMHAAFADEDDLLGPYSKYLSDEGWLEAFRNDYTRRAEKGYIVGASHDSVLPTEHFEDVFIGRHAAEWIRNIDDDHPWHLFVSFVGPHDPFDPPSEYSKSIGQPSVPPAIPPSPQQPVWLQEQRMPASEEEIAHIRHQYCALVKLVDDQVGTILDALESRDMLENTYIIFVSDHGEMLGDHGLFQKRVPYDPSIRIPLIVSGPNIEANTVAETLVELIDLNATICDLAEVRPAEGMDSRSFQPVLNDNTMVHRNEILTGMFNFRCLRTDRYKYTMHLNASPELFDLVEDPNETQNIVEQMPAVADNLKQRLSHYLLRDDDVPDGRKT